MFDDDDDEDDDDEDDDMFDVFGCAFGTSSQVCVVDEAVGAVGAVGAVRVMRLLSPFCLCAAVWVSGFWGFCCPPFLTLCEIGRSCRPLVCAVRLLCVVVCALRDWLQREEKDGKRGRENGLFALVFFRSDVILFWIFR